MTEYTDIPQISDLYKEQQLVQTAIYNLESSGSILNMTVAPPTHPVAPPTPSPGEPAEVPPPVSAISVIIDMNLPNPPELITATLTALKARDNAITAELESLGVVNTPVKR